MTPQEDDPWIPVSVMGEHIFCPRAGVIEFESKCADIGEEGFVVTKQRGLIYSIPVLKRKLIKEFFFSVILVIIGITLYYLFPFFSTHRPFSSQDIAIIFYVLLFVVAPLSVLVLFFVFLCKFFGSLFTYITAVSSLATEPAPVFDTPQNVNWWGLLQSGFQVQYFEGLRDTKWRLIGNPWRILIRGNLRIPIMRKWGGQKLYRQHYARIAAYCHLIEFVDPGAASPYGVVLFGNTYNGFAIPNSPSTRKTFHDSLLYTRETFRQMGSTITGPLNTNKCCLCPHGRPTSKDYGDTWTSECGNRFYWTPPHQRAYEKELL